MAKDVIQITDKETGETGNVRDSRLALAKEKTAVALTDAIELRTIDDKQIFVKADSFFNAFAQWCKANNKSTITSLFGELTADGVSSPGSINMANLASVLSVNTLIGISEITVGSYNVETPYIRVTGGHTITFYSPDQYGITGATLGEYNGNKESVDSWQCRDEPRQVTLNANTKFVRLPCRKTRISECYIRDDSEGVLLFGKP